MGSEDGEGVDGHPGQAVDARGCDREEAPAIRTLLHQLANVADVKALLLLYRRLDEDLYR
ncbi:hypothetical protein J7E91_21415 [Streptomyces sp. ISL-99]|uniref:hypothetical protein n=1 Tax=Streptomyces sp. ISL-99 TaxID=2819193 RepID=UPI001BE7CA51|nr:hypothetical protein [Streptomyces sp. ISL-99]MBT2527910.1 hypothetical protein [Streptomyces sp. ISL-99]